MALTNGHTVSGEDAAKIRTAALEAIKSIRGASLGDGDINNIISQIGSSSLSLAEKMTQAANMATTIAEQEKNKPINYASASPDEINRDRVARGLLPLGLQGAYGSNRAGRDGRGAGAESGRSDYQGTLGYASAQSLVGVSEANFGKTPFAAAGINYGTVVDLRRYDRNFTGKDVMNAANSNRALGLDVNDREAMRDQSSIEHYDNNAPETNRAMQEYKRRTFGDQDLNDLIKRRVHAKGAERQELDAQIKAKREKHMEESGVSGRIRDPHNHPLATKAIPHQLERVNGQRMKQLEHESQLDPNARAMTVSHYEPDKTLEKAKQQEGTNEAREKLRADVAASEGTSASGEDSIMEKLKAKRAAKLAEENRTDHSNAEPTQRVAALENLAEKKLEPARENKPDDAQKKKLEEAPANKSEVAKVEPAKVEQKSEPAKPKVAAAKKPTASPSMA